jgi:hypothetical protein
MGEGRMMFKIKRIQRKVPVEGEVPEQFWKWFEEKLKEAHDKKDSKEYNLLSEVDLEETDDIEGKKITLWEGE